jgi:pimeloyl-ACP methyl ester carboxylesterase
MLRAFCDLANRQVHYRHGGSGGIPLLLLHPSPGSARQFEALGNALSATRHVIAPDRPGNGDSPALPLPAPEIADYAAADLAFLDALGISEFDVYGMHTGAWVAAELAIRAPARVRRVILDGFGMFSPDEVARYLALYAPPVSPDPDGSYLQWAFGFIRAQSLYFPWFDTRPENARLVELPSAAALHDSVLELLKSIRTYHLGYHAAFRYDAAARLPLVGQPTLAISADDDPLYGHLEAALRLLPNAVTQPVGSLRAPRRAADLARVIDTFLAPAD